MHVFWWGSAFAFGLLRLTALTFPFLGLTAFRFTLAFLRVTRFLFAALGFGLPFVAFGLVAGLALAFLAGTAVAGFFAFALSFLAGLTVVFTLTLFCVGNTFPVALSL